MLGIFGIERALPPSLAWLAAPATLALNLLFWVALTGAVLIATRWLLRRVTRSSRTRLDDAIVGIVRRPLIVLMLSYGLLRSWEVAFGSSGATDVLRRLHKGVLIVLVAYVAWRILYEVVIAYLRPIVEESDSQADDVIVPILGRVGPVVIVVALANAVVATLGGNLAALLTGLGLLGLVIGYLFQEPLQGLFSGTYMVLDNPFRQDDLIMLDDGSMCQVREIGVRVTQLYDVKRHVLRYMPNSKLAAAQIVNVTKPSVELRQVLNITMDRHASPLTAAALLKEACDSHENILGLWPNKRDAIRRRQEAYRASLDRLSALPQRTQTDEAQVAYLKHQVGRLEGELARLRAEHTLRQSGEEFSRGLLSLMRLAAQLEDGGLIAAERARLREQVESILAQFDALVEQITVWLFLLKVSQYELVEDACDLRQREQVRAMVSSEGALSIEVLAACGAPDKPVRAMVRREDLAAIHSSDTEADKVVVRDHFRDRSGYTDYHRLYSTWHRNITRVYRGLMRLHRLETLEGMGESRLDAEVAKVESHFADTFLLTVGGWQLPSANLVDAGDVTLKFQLEVFIDDIMREQFQRDERVTTELLIEIDRIRNVYLASLDQKAVVGPAA